MSKFHSYIALELNGSKLKKKQHNSTINTMYQVGSCSKFITALVVAKLYELGKLDYDVDINKYLKKWKCPKLKTGSGPTLRMLLTHTSGSDDSNGYLGSEPITQLKQTNELNIQIINGKKYAKGINFNEPPGKFRYSGAGYQVVQQVIEEITGKPLYQVMEKYIFKPLNMTHSTGKLIYPKSTRLNDHKYPIASMNNTYRMYAETAAAGVWMSAGDLLALSIDLLKSYHDDNGTLLKRDTLLKVISGDVDVGSIQYGLGCHVGSKSTKKEAFGHFGLNYGYSMRLNIFPKLNKVKIQMINYKPELIDGKCASNVDLSREN
jgi:CubicO group peptidase (beta-lactamase class C family)